MSFAAARANTLSTSPSSAVDAGSLFDEKRASTRHSRPLRARIVRLGADGVAEAAARDISEGGLFLTVAPSVGLGVGQRCEVELFDADGSALGCLPEGSCFATVVRTEFVTTESSARMVGAGLRFDHPLYL